MQSCDDGDDDENVVPIGVWAHLEQCFTHKPIGVRGQHFHQKAPQSPPRHRGGLVEDAPVLVLGLCLQQQSCCNPSVRMRCEEQSAALCMRRQERGQFSYTVKGTTTPTPNAGWAHRWRTDSSVHVGGVWVSSNSASPAASNSAMSLRLKVRMVYSYIFVP